MKNKNILLVIIAVVLVVFAIGINLFVFYNNKNTNDKTNDIETIYEVIDDTKKGNVVLDDESMAEIEKAKEPEKNNENNVIEESKTQDLDVTNVKDLVLKDKNENVLSNEDFKDKANFIMFYDNSNDDSIEMLNRVNSEYGKYKEKINFIVIDISEEIKSDINDKYDFDIYYDVDNKTKDAYEIKNTPSMIYILEDGELLHSKFGLTTKDALQANLDILSGNF